MKKVFASIAIVALLVGSVSVTGCGKYEEGPSVSLRTKKARVVGTWEIEKVMENGVDITTDIRAVIASESIEFKKDETFTASQTLTSLFGGGTEIVRVAPGHLHQTKRKFQLLLPKTTLPPQQQLTFSVSPTKSSGPKKLTAAIPMSITTKRSNLFV
jgi:hypothetical protein